MQRWIVGLLTIVLLGCGNGGVSDLNVSSTSSPQALESGELEDNLNFINKGTLNHSGLIREFDVDLFTQSPLHRESKIYISDQNTFRISLKTLDLLTEEKRFPLIEADEIVSNGLPNVIPPKGYTVRLEIVGNQVIAVMKSTTAPEKPENTTRVQTGSNDIIIGDLRKSLLFLKGTSNTLFFPKMKKEIRFQAFNRLSYQGLNYASSSQWFGQVDATPCGMDKFLSITLGKSWDFLNTGTIQASIQYIHNCRDTRSLEMASIKYSTPLFRGYEGHIVFTTTLDQPWEQGAGAGISMRLIPHENFHMDVILGSKIWSFSAIYEINL